MPKKTIRYCDECETGDANYNRTLEKYLCSECSESNDYTLICKSTAKQEYFLTEKDLGDLEYYEANNPHWKSAHSMKLYTKADVISKFREKYDVDSDNEDDKKKELEKKREKRSASVKDAREYSTTKRRKKLVSALSKYKLKLRGDSVLCQKYINGTLDKEWTVDKIVERMCEMHYLFNYGKKYIEQSKRSYNATLEAGYLPDCSIVEDAEMLMLDKIDDYPDTWPWMKN
jgi:hypothetical protein